MIDLSNVSIPEVTIDNLVELYNIESGLIQRKVNQILTIRSISITFLVGVTTLSGLVQQTNTSGDILLLLVLLFLPFYLLESVYDSHLIPMHNREILMKSEIARAISVSNYDHALSEAYSTNGVDVYDFSNHSPLYYALTRKIRIIYYLVIVLIYILIAMFVSNFI